MAFFKIKKIKNFFSLQTKISIDLGTSNTLVSVNKQIIFNEPTVIAYNKITHNIISIGFEAKSILGKSPKNISSTRPVFQGVIKDFDLTKQFILNLLNKNNQVDVFSKLLPVKVLVGIPSSINSVEYRSLKDSISEIGISNIYLFYESIASAIGSGFDIFKESSFMIIDIGGGTSDITIIAGGEILENVSSKIAGDYIDKQIKNFLKTKYQIEVGDNQVEDIKKRIPSLFSSNFSLSSHKIKITGKNLIDSTPFVVEIDLVGLRAVVLDSLNKLINQVLDIIKNTSPEVSADLNENGILLTGGGSLFIDIDLYFNSKLNLPIIKSPDALNSVVLGLDKVFEDWAEYQKFFILEDDLLIN